MKRAETKSTEFLDEKEIKLVKLMRTLRSAEARVIVQDKLPIRVEVLYNSTELS